MIISKFGSHPQKCMLKIVCRLMYIFGIGNCWYEESQKPLYLKKLKNILNIFVHIYLLVVLVDEYLAFFRTEDKNDPIQMAIGLTFIYIKVIAVWSRNTHIKQTLKRMVEDDREIYFSLSIERASVKKAMKYSACLAIVIFGSITSAAVVGLSEHLKKGVAYKSVVTYYPTPENSGIFVNILRFFIECHWWYFGAILTIVDTLSYCTLIFVEHKFKLLQEYFKRIRKEYVDNIGTKSEEELVNTMKKQFTDGIKLHQNALWCASNVQSSLGNVYSLQILHCVIIIVNTLIKLTTEDHSTPLVVATMTLLVTMAFLIGSYMTNAGDITWEADELSSAIYDCGWELLRGQYSRQIRTLVVITIMRSQVPVYMTAFGIVPLSYANFVAVLRLSYSFFAVLY